MVESLPSKLKALRLVLSWGVGDLGTGETAQHLRALATLLEIAVFDF